jgi:hypothetical protein
MIALLHLLSRFGCSGDATFSFATYLLFFLRVFIVFVVHIFVKERINILLVVRSCGASAAIRIFTE